MFAVHMILMSIMALFSLTVALPGPSPSPSSPHSSRIFGISLSERGTYVACAMACRACRSCSEWTYDPDETSSCEYSCDTACAVDPFRYKANADGQVETCPTSTEELKARWNVRDSKGLKEREERRVRKNLRQGIIREVGNGENE